MKRRILAVIVAAVMIVTTMSPPDIAFAEQPSDPPLDSGTPSCFGNYARTTKKVPDAGPGSATSEITTTLGQLAPGGNEHAAQVLNQIRVKTGICGDPSE
jgi:hypothetical protein